MHISIKATINQNWFSSHIWWDVLTFIEVLWARVYYKALRNQLWLQCQHFFSWLAVSLSTFWCLMLIDSAMNCSWTLFAEISRLFELLDSTVLDLGWKLIPIGWAMVEVCHHEVRMSAIHHLRKNDIFYILNHLIENLLRSYSSLAHIRWENLPPSAKLAYCQSRLNTAGRTPFHTNID